MRVAHAAGASGRVLGLPGQGAFVAKPRFHLRKASHKQGVNAARQESESLTSVALLGHGRTEADLLEKGRMWRLEGRGRG